MEHPLNGYDRLIKRLDWLVKRLDRLIKRLDWLIKRLDRLAAP